MTSAAILFAALSFGNPVPMPDLALECAIPKGAKAEPVEMPRAEAYIAGDPDSPQQRLEDRFDVFDLWRAESVRARWIDADGNRFSICRVERKIPDDAGGVSRTRRDFVRRYAKAGLGPKDLDSLDEAVYVLAPAETGRRIAPRRSQRKNLSQLWMYETTNENVFVYAFVPRKEGRESAPWYVVSLVSDDPYATELIDGWLDEVSALRDREAEPERKKPAVEDLQETALLADSYRRNVANYLDWHFTSVSNVVIVDGMSSVCRSQFVSALTNTFPAMQAAYRAALPPVSGEESHVAAVRIFDSREEYLAYVGPDMKWSAALWSPVHRELVLYYPEKGSQQLLNTVWHEALHQHLDYACLMAQTPPWFNEGHAELFGNSHLDSDGSVIFDAEPESAMFVQANAARLAELLPGLFEMDYPEFYAGDDEERRLKYRLAWSVAYFLQIGAPKVRFRPFENLRRDMMEETARTRRRDEANRIVMTAQTVKNLVEEWLAFWKRQ